MTTAAVSRLVVPLDGSPAAERALPVAQALATGGDAPITVVAVVAAEDQVSEAAAMLRRATAGLRAPVSVDVLVGLPAGTALTEYVRGDDKLLLVMTTHARTAIGELLLGSVADEVVRRSSVPVVLVGPHVAAPRGDAYHDVVLCVDGSHTSERLVPLAPALHEGLGLHPWLFQVRQGHSASGPIVGADALETNQVHRIADELADRGLDVDWDVGHGDDRAEAIVDFAASRHQPIIALATRGQDPTARLAESSLTVTVTRTAPCPVLVIGPLCVVPTLAGATPSTTTR